MGLFSTISPISHAFNVSPPLDQTQKPIQLETRITNRGISYVSTSLSDFANGELIEALTMLSASRAIRMQYQASFGSQSGTRHLRHRGVIESYDHDEPSEHAFMDPHGNGSFDIWS